MALLRIESLYKDFSGLQVLSGINMEVLEGERHAIIGPNGAGKSTLFNVITGMYRKTKGNIFFRDKSIDSWPIHKIAQSGISRSFQITNIYPKMTVYENVRNAIISKLDLRFRWYRLLSGNGRIHDETDRIISLTGLTDISDSLAMELSYGRQRQLELGLTIAQDPTLIMLDEPTAGLDSEETRKTIELIKRISEGRTLIIVDHDMEVVFYLADRITVLHEGQILAVGKPDEIRENEAVKKAYLGRG